MNEPADTTLDVGILVDSEFVEQWQRDALDRLVRELDAEITTVVVNDQETDADRDRNVTTELRDAVERLRTYPLWSLLGVVRTLTDDPAHEQPVRVDSVPGVASAEWVSCTTQTVDKYWETFPAGTVELLAETDIVVRFGFGMIKGDVLEAPTHGVVSYHMGDIREYRGQPGGFWEFLNSESEMGVTVQRLTETLDGGEIAALERFDISQSHTYQAVWRRAHDRATTLLVPAVRTLTREDRCLRAPDELGTLYSMPEGADVVRYLCKNTRGRIRSRIWDAATTDREASLAVTVLLLVTGALLTTARPVLGDRSRRTVHPEQLLGAGLLGVSLLRMGRRDRTGLPLP